MSGHARSETAGFVAFISQTLRSAGTAELELRQTISAAFLYYAKQQIRSQLLLRRIVVPSTLIVTIFALFTDST
jgi:hypothetical protein